MVNLNKVPLRDKTTSWSTEETGAWDKYRRESQQVGLKMMQNLENIDDIERADKMMTKEMKGLYYKCFKRRTTKTPRPERNKVVLDNAKKIEKVARKVANGK